MRREKRIEKHEKSRILPKPFLTEYIYRYFNRISLCLSIYGGQVPGVIARAIFCPVIRQFCRRHFIVGKGKQRKFIKYSRKRQIKYLTKPSLCHIIFRLWKNGVWRSLVSRLVRDQEAPGSNPGTPTKKEWQSSSEDCRFFFCWLRKPPAMPVEVFRKRALASSIERSESGITIRPIHIHPIKTANARLRAVGDIRCAAFSVRGSRPSSGLTNRG